MPTTGSTTERQIRPLLVTPPPSSVPGARFDQARVEHVVRFFRTLKHTKGKWAGVAYEPEPWEIEFLLAPVFGWVHPDGTRIVRTVWWEMPRKQGKSTRASACGLYLLAADREQGAEVYAAAGDKDQAGLVFNPAKEMAEASPGLRQRTQRFKTSIVYPKTRSTFKVLSSAAETKHGLNVHGAVIDEVHIHKTRDLIDVLETGTGSREQPLVIFITTADDGEQTTIYAEKRGYIEQLAAGTVTDPTTYGVVFAAPKDADPFDEQTWEDANPGIDVTVKRSYLRKEAGKAKAVPGYLATFQRLHLGVRTRADGVWFSVESWDQGGGLLDEADLAGEPCHGGIDLAATTDFNAWMLWFPRQRVVLTRIFVPEGAVKRRPELAAQLRTWARQGYLTITDGEITDEAALERQIDADASRFQVRHVGYDPWNATGLVGRLEDKGLSMVRVSQGIATLNDPTKRLEKIVALGDWNHGGHPVLRWMARNVRKDEDSAGNIKPSKRKSAEKIDGISALVNALLCEMTDPEADYDVMESIF
jgi:phage terminase large subunit-like protein